MQARQQTPSSDLRNPVLRWIFLVVLTGTTAVGLLGLAIGGSEPRFDFLTGAVVFGLAYALIVRRRPKLLAQVCGLRARGVENLEIVLED